MHMQLTCAWDNIGRKISLAGLLDAKVPIKSTDVTAYTAELSTSIVIIAE